MMYGPDGFGYGGFGILSGVFMLIFWAAIIFAIFALVRGLTWGCRGSHCRKWQFHGDEDSAISLLRERYAKGEIGKEEFLERKKELERDKEKPK